MATYSGVILDGVILYSKAHVVGYIDGYPILYPPTSNPVVVAKGAYITNIYGGTAIYGQIGVAWDLTNYGTVKSAGSYDGALFLGGGGNIYNSGLIRGVTDGVGVSGGIGTLINEGTVFTTGDFVNHGPNGLFFAGVFLSDGGVVTNGTAGSANGLITSEEIGIYIGGEGGVPKLGATGTVTIKLPRIIAMNADVC